MRLAFLTSTPQAIRQGSGTYVAIRTLQHALEARGVEVELVRPTSRIPIITARRLLFNERLRLRDWTGFDAVAGFDMDGYRIAGRTGGRYFASIKGVIADELQFESGITRALLDVQARCEREHVLRADRVLTTSCYSAARIEALYGLKRRPLVIPEPIDLNRWNVQRTEKDAFVVLTVCRFYKRKRIDLLLAAADLLRDRIPGLEFRIVGSGPVRFGAHAGVTWLGDLSFDRLQQEYAGADVFCLPSVQEGFGIVLLEAMASGIPIVAARASAVPEVVPQGLLAEPGDANSLAQSILRLYREPGLRNELSAAGLERVQEFDAPLVAERFLQAIS